MNSKIVMTAVAAAALLGATSLSNAQTSAPANAAAAQKQQDDAVNAQAATKVVKPAPKGATAAKPAARDRQTVGAADNRKNEAGPSGSVAPGAPQGNASQGSPAAGTSNSGGTSQGGGSSN